MSTDHSSAPVAESGKAVKAAPRKPRARRRPLGYIRADSLWAALGDEDKRHTVCDWLFAQGLNATACVRQIDEDFGVRTTVKAVKFFYQQHAFLWKIGEAKCQAEIEKDQLPPDWEARVRQALAQRRFEATFKNLTQQQIIAFEKLDLERARVDLKKNEVSFAERRLILLEKKMQKAQETLEDSTMSAEEQARRIRRILGAE